MWSMAASLGGAVPITAYSPNPPPSSPKTLLFPCPIPISKQKRFHSRPLPFTSSFNTSAVASDHLQSDKQEKEATKYHFVVANAKFMLDEEEHFQELMFERLRNYGERSKEQDFWLVIEPKFLDNFPNLTKRLARPAVALVSTNAPWITFMKLRLDRVLCDCYEATSLDEALASNPATLEFGQPKKWSAPYPKYEFGWWEPFLPKGIQESKV
ncbi:PREDICTED: uncharacterized protein LOC104809827 [Tarenaya hassleriana]|uniref:uncharacterized protein LOC104809827 n=1 Tax=Tarenaya hassleriana TaxID=28532 RepID=UPI00053C2E45|nr:PREDICTED: uncharacterized protein LOC104809827 [Tarenaya hassleriana]XP_019057689.1 PREDICTED: uncharacterized protein LOC104809827 [Tarenaya hassleriana]